MTTGFSYDPTIKTKEELDQNRKINVAGFQEIVVKLETIFDGVKRTLQFYQEGLQYTGEILEDVQEFYKLHMEQCNDMEVKKQALTDEIKELRYQKGLLQEMKPKERDASDTFMTSQVPAAVLGKAIVETDSPGVPEPPLPRPNTEEETTAISTSSAVPAQARTSLKARAKQMLGL